MPELRGQGGSGGGTSDLLSLLLYQTERERDILSSEDQSGVKYPLNMIMSDIE